jgi:hypothetical protein
VCQEGPAACRFDLVGDPIPVDDALEGDESASWEVLQKGLDGARFMIDPGLVLELTSLIENGEAGIVLVGVASDPIMRHGCTSFACVLSRHECSGRCSAFI